MQGSRVIQTRQWRQAKIQAAAIYWNSAVRAQ